MWQLSRICHTSKYNFDLFIDNFMIFKIIVLDYNYKITSDKNEE